MLDEEGELQIPPTANLANHSSANDFCQDEAIDVHGATPPKEELDGFAPDLDAMGGVVRTLDGEEIDDEFAQDAMNYQILLGKIDTLLDRLKLDA